MSTEQAAVEQKADTRTPSVVVLRVSGKDLRHTAITNDAAAGSSPIAVKAKAGHANMAPTQRYVHLAGVVFRDEADRLAPRLLGGTKLYPSEMILADVTEPEPSVHAGTASSIPA